MEQRERLIKILDNYGDDISFCDRCDRPTEDCEACKNEQLAEFLLANGVIVAPMPMADWLRQELTEYVHERCLDEL